MNLQGSQRFAKNRKQSRIVAFVLPPGPALRSNAYYVYALSGRSRSLVQNASEFLMSASLGARLPTAPTDGYVGECVVPK
jgi:hypothetical protein